MHAEDECATLLLVSAILLEDAVARKVKRSAEFQMAVYREHGELTCDTMRDLGWQQSCNHPLATSQLQQCLVAVE